jgi:hypothetical protein
MSRSVSLSQDRHTGRVAYCSRNVCARDCGSRPRARETRIRAKPAMDRHCQSGPALGHRESENLEIISGRCGGFIKIHIRKPDSRAALTENKEIIAAGADAEVSQAGPHQSASAIPATSIWSTKNPSKRPFSSKTRPATSTTSIRSAERPHLPLLFVARP